MVVRLMPAAMAWRHRSALSIRPTSHPILRPASAAGPKRPLPARCTKASPATLPSVPCVPVRSLHDGYGRGRKGSLRLFHEPAAGPRAGVIEHSALPARHRGVASRLEAHVLFE